MNDDFVRLVEHHCQWIADEVKNFRHSERLPIGLLYRVGE